jgi:DNA-binding transcriptional regulator YiaG
MANVLALKEEGTSPPIEGMLSKFAEIHGIRSTQEGASLAAKRFDIVLIDTSMPRIAAQSLVEALKKRGIASRSIIVLMDFRESPAQLRRRLDQLARLNLRARTKHPDLKSIMRLLQVSQETLARILNVSARTVHRWLGQTHPRHTPELQRLERVVELLTETLGTVSSVHHYLNHPNPSLGGETPMALVLRGEFDPVHADLQALREGVYV